MKTLYLMRHTKSSWKHPELTDIERPLNKRGKRDAPFMGKILHERGVKPDLILSSPAKRTLNTARLIAKELDCPKKRITIDERIYESDEKLLLNALHDVEDSHNCIVMIGHNPDFTYFAEFLCNQEFENIPTGGIVAIEFDTNSWEAVSAKNAKLIFFEYPKKYK